MNCWGTPLLCKIHGVDVQLKDYGGGSSEKKVFRAQVALEKFVAISPVSVHYNAKRPRGKLSEEYTLYRIAISIFVHAFVIFW
ncbi:hypothetical protein ACFXTH_001224 [Malus domestica]